MGLALAGPGKLRGRNYQLADVAKKPLLPLLLVLSLLGRLLAGDPLLAAPPSDPAFFSHCTPPAAAAAMLRLVPSLAVAGGPGFA